MTLHHLLTAYVTVAPPRVTRSVQYRRGAAKRVPRLQAVSGRGVTALTRPLVVGGVTWTYFVDCFHDTSVDGSLKRGRTRRSCPSRIVAAGNRSGWRSKSAATSPSSVKGHSGHEMNTSSRS